MNSEWLTLIGTLLFGGGLGSLVTLVATKARRKKPTISLPLADVRVALNLEGSHAWLVVHEIEERIFERGGRVVPLPSGWTPEKAASLKQSNLSYPDVVVEGSAGVSTAAYVALRMYTGEGSQIGTYREQDGNKDVWNVHPLCDGAVRECEAAVRRWQAQEPLQALERELRPQLSQHVEPERIEATEPEQQQVRVRC